MAVCTSQDKPVRPADRRRELPTSGSAARCFQFFTPIHTGSEIALYEVKLR